MALIHFDRFDYRALEERLLAHYYADLMSKEMATYFWNDFKIVEMDFPQVKIFPRPEMKVSRRVMDGIEIARRYIVP